MKGKQRHSNAVGALLLMGTMVLEYPHMKRHKEVRRRVNVRQRSRFCNKVSFDTLLIGICFGLAGVLIDLDHLFPGMARADHLPIAILCGLVLCGAIALDYRHVHNAGVAAKDDFYATR